MKYFVRDWNKDIIKSKKIMQEYSNYYKSIEEQISVNVKNVLFIRLMENMKYIFCLMN